MKSPRKLCWNASSSRFYGESQTITRTYILRKDCRKPIEPSVVNKKLKRYDEFPKAELCKWVRSRSQSHARPHVLATRHCTGQSGVAFERRSKLTGAIQSKVFKIPFSIWKTKFYDMKFSVDVENISKILFLDFSFFENMSLKNISAWLGGNLLLRLLPETVVAGHICMMYLI